MKINTSRFGELAIDLGGIITVKGGLLGFPEQEKFVLINAEDEGPFKWLQSTEAPDLAFVLIDPRLVDKSYRVEVQREILDALEIGDVSRCLVFALVTLNRDPMKVTANLMGPLLINPENGLGRQVVLSDSPYTTRHPILGEE